MKREWALVLAAVQALTRVPVAVPGPFDPDALRRAVRYFPLVGVFAGGLAACVLGIALDGLPAMAAALLSLAATVLLTGALHEDGLADCCDGLFGGRTREDALRIMRDSRVGAFGAIGLVVVLGLKVACVAGLAQQGGAVQAGLALIAGHAAGRFWAVLPPVFLPYARADGMAGGVARPDQATLVVAGMIGLVPLLLLGARAAPALLVSGGIALLFGLWVRHRLGGYTGDVLGAMQVLTETGVLLAALWRVA